MAQRVWLVTGISSGIGQALANAILKAGDQVVGTFRKQVQVDLFNQQHKGRALGVLCDTTQPQQLEHLIESALKAFGRIDVLVNNAGVGFVGAVEESSDEEIRRIFEVNVFATIKLTQLILPIFRQQKSGHVVQMSSMSGVRAIAGFGIYGASKFALEGYSEGLYYEVKPLGINVTLVEPGPFRTNFAGSSLSEAKNRLADYEPTAGKMRSYMHEETNGQQEGDPEKGAKAIVEMVQSGGQAPLRFPLGVRALKAIGDKLESVKADMEANRQVAESVVFPD
jgi:NAD(P)-dependent dehydrogenase (short-subunit alcohol dehydrogenase family)